MKIFNINKFLLILLIALVSFVMHFEHFSKDLMSIHVWRQAETQTTINNFFEEDFNILNPRQNKRGDGDGIFRREFPLMQWLIAGTYYIFGSHLIITRLFMFIFGLFSVWGMYELLFQIFKNKSAAIIAAWTFNFSPGFYYYTINPMPDNFALSCAIWGIVIFFFWYRHGKANQLFWSGVLLSLGALAKLPFILYFTVPGMYFLLQFLRGTWDRKTFRNILLVSMPMILPLAWYVWVIPKWGGMDILDGILESRSGLLSILDYLQFNLISTLPEVLLGYGSLILFISGCYFLFRNRAYKSTGFVVFLVWGLIILAYFIFEIDAIRKIHDYYLFPFYPLLFILVGYGAFQMLELKGKVWRYLVYLIVLAAPFICYARMHGRWDEDAPGFNKDLLTYKQELRMAVPKDALCIVGDDVSPRVFLYYIDKKGWVLGWDGYGVDNFNIMVEKGAEYLYSDSKSIHESLHVIPYLDELISEHGSIRVYHLKTSNLPR